MPSLDEHARSSLVALGELVGLAGVRAVIARTTEIRSWSPRPDARWDQAAAQLRDTTQDDTRQRGWSIALRRTAGSTWVSEPSR